MRHEIQDLRKRSFVFYNGKKGPELVDRLIRKSGLNPDTKNPEELKKLRLLIIQQVFVQQFGLERTKEILHMQVAHVPGYRPVGAEKQEKKTKITFNLNFMKYIIIILLALLALAGCGLFMYMRSFERASVCEMKEGLQRDVCYANVALRKRNSTYCSLVEDSYEKAKCYSSLGSAIGDVEICKEIVDNGETQSLFEVCVTCAAKKSGDSSICNVLKNPVRISYCTHQLSRTAQMDICPS